MKFLNYIKAAYQLLWVKSHEEHRVLIEYVAEIATLKHEQEVFHSQVWDVADGIRTVTFKKGVLESSDPIPDTAADPLLPLTWLDEKAPENTILFLKDYHPFLKKEFQDSTLITRKIRNLVTKFKAQGKVLVILSPTVEVPLELDKEMTVIEYKLPEAKDLRIVLKSVCAAVGAPYPKDDTLIIDSALGMTSTEAENAFSVSLIEANKFDDVLIRKEKAQIVKKTGILEVIDSNLTLEDIGGLENLKEWLTARQKCFSPEAKTFGVTPPKGLLLVGVPGCGKAQPLDSPIYTPKGSVRMGDIRVGDVICHPFKGTATIQEIHPQGMKDIYRVTFHDGTSTECCEDHLWEVSLRDKRRSKINRFVLALREFKDRVISRDKYLNLAIRITHPVQFSTRRVKLDPYLLGVLLGDGALGNDKDIHQHQRVIGLTSADSFIVDRVSKIIKHIPYHLLRKVPSHKIQYSIVSLAKVNKQVKKGKFFNLYKRALSSYGLLNLTTERKFIPEDYLFNSIKTRLALLRGLCDTDGHITKNNAVELSTTSRVMSLNIKELVESLGGICTITQKRGSYKKNGIRILCKMSYRCWIKFDNLNPFSLPRKAIKYRSRSKYPLKRFITNIEYIGQKEAQCITISEPDGLYLTNDFIITHNSLTAKVVATAWGRPLLRLDMGSVFGSYVGESEHNMKKVLDMAEAVAPCVLWIR